MVNKRCGAQLSLRVVEVLLSFWSEIWHLIASRELKTIRLLRSNGTHRMFPWCNLPLWDFFKVMFRHNCKLGFVPLSFWSVILTFWGSRELRKSNERTIQTRAQGGEYSSLQDRRRGQTTVYLQEGYFTRKGSSCFSAEQLNLWLEVLYWERDKQGAVHLHLLTFEIIEL